MEGVERTLWHILTRLPLVPRGFEVLWSLDLLSSLPGYSQLLAFLDNRHGLRLLFSYPLGPDHVPPDTWHYYSSVCFWDFAVLWSRPSECPCGGRARVTQLSYSWMICQAEAKEHYQAVDADGIIYATERCTFLFPSKYCLSQLHERIIEQV